MCALALVACFVAAAFSATPGISAETRPLIAEAQFVSDILRVMGEPPIGHVPPGDQVFRFLWLRSFHKPFLVQVEKRGDVAELVVKSLDGPWSRKRVSTLAYEKRTKISSDAWDRLAAMRRDAFWGQPSSDPAEMGDDGAMWILEGSSWGEYHIVERWTPTEGAFREMGIAMLELAGVNVAAERVY